MVLLEPILVEENTIVSIEVKLPKTNLLILKADLGYVMCGALDVAFLSNDLSHRQIIAARAVGVKTINELLNGTIDSCTPASQSLGIREKMPVREALLLMCTSKPIMDTRKRA